MTACGAVGALIVGGRVVGQLRCEREAGHTEPSRREMHDFGGRSGICHRCGTGRRQSPLYDCEPTPGTPHAVTLTWTPGADPDLDLFDPDEAFDVAVDI